jgi:hypothetical protein
MIRGGVLLRELGVFLAVTILGGPVTTERGLAPVRTQLDTTSLHAIAIYCLAFPRVSLDTQAGHRRNDGFEPRRLRHFSPLKSG